MTLDRSTLSARKNRGRLITFGLLGLFALGVWGGISAVGWDEINSALARLSLFQFLLILGLASLHYMLRALRWHLLARAVSLPTSLQQNFLHFFGGFAMTATPGRLGELVRLRWMCAETDWPIEKVAPVALGDRAIELIGMLVMIVFAVAFMQTSIAGIFWLLTVAGVLVLIALNPTLLSWFVTQTWRAVGRAPRVFVRLRQITRGLAPFTQPGVLGLTSVISTVGWFLEGLALYLLLSWLGADTSLAAATAIFLVAVLSGALSGLPGGLGSTEAVSVGLLTLQGVPVEIALIATVVLRVATLWYAVAIGAVTFGFAEARLRKLDATEAPL